MGNSRSSPLAERRSSPQAVPHLSHHTTELCNKCPITWKQWRRRCELSDFSMSCNLKLREHSSFFFFFKKPVTENVYNRNILRKYLQRFLTMERFGFLTMAGLAFFFFLIHLALSGSHFKQSHRKKKCPHANLT